MNHSKRSSAAGSQIPSSNPLYQFFAISLTLPVALNGNRKEKHRRLSALTEFEPNFFMLNSFLLSSSTFVPFRFSLLCLLIFRFFIFLFSFFFPTLSFALMYTQFFGVSEFGRCFINFSSTHSTHQQQPTANMKASKTRRSVFQLIGVSFLDIFYFALLRPRQQQHRRQLTEWALLWSVHLCGCVSEQSIHRQFPFCSHFPPFRFFNRTPQQNETTQKKKKGKKHQNEMWKGMDRFGCVCFIIFPTSSFDQNCTPSLFSHFAGR